MKAEDAAVAGYLKDILEHARLARDLVGGLTTQEFTLDLRTRLAVERALEIVGEAAKRIPEDIRSAYPDLPWKDMEGLPGMVAHQDRKVNAAIIHRTVTMDTRRLLATLPKVIADLAAEGERQAPLTPRSA